MKVADYSTANAVLTGRNSQSRKLQNNTYLERRGETIAVRLHATDVITYHPNGDTVFDTGGWKTVTTKDRMNEYSPAIIRSEKGAWYIGVFNGTWDKTKWVPFADGITLHADGFFSGIGDDPKADLKLKRQAAKYSKDYMQAFLAGEIEAPGAGDCFYCGLHTVNGSKPLGEAFQSADHIKSHIEEKYYVPSLLANAIKRFPVSQAAMWLIGSQWDSSASSEQKQTAYQAGTICADQLQRSLRRYINDQLGFQG